MDLETLTASIRKDLADLSEASIVTITAKVADSNSVLVHKVKALDQVIQQMATPQYKRKITLAKRD